MIQVIPISLNDQINHVFELYKRGREEQSGQRMKNAGYEMSVEFSRRKKNCALTKFCGNFIFHSVKRANLHRDYHRFFYSTKARRDDAWQVVRAAWDAGEKGFMSVGLPAEPRVPYEQARYEKELTLTEAEVKRQIAQQKGVCLVCGSREAIKVDLDPATFTLRGMLCSPCDDCKLRIEARLVWENTPCNYRRVVPPAEAEEIKTRAFVVSVNHERYGDADDYYLETVARSGCSCLLAENHEAPEFVDQHCFYFAYEGQAKAAWHRLNKYRELEPFLRYMKIGIILDLHILAPDGSSISPGEEVIYEYEYEDDI